MLSSALISTPAAVTIKIRKKKKTQQKGKHAGLSYLVSFKFLPL